MSVWGGGGSRQRDLGEESRRRLVCVCVCGGGGGGGGGGEGIGFQDRPEGSSCACSTSVGGTGPRPLSSAYELHVCVFLLLQNNIIVLAGPVQVAQLVTADSYPSTLLSAYTKC